MAEVISRITPVSSFPVAASGTYYEEYAFQYLVSLTAGLAAMEYLCWNRVLPHLQNYTATVVMLGEPPTQPSSSHQFLFDAIDNHWDKILRADAKEILRGKLASAGGAGCRVHAEAGIMALDAHLHSAEVPADMQEIATIFVSASSSFAGRCRLLLSRSPGAHRSATCRDHRKMLPGVHEAV